MPVYSLAVIYRRFKYQKLLGNLINLRAFGLEEVFLYGARDNQMSTLPRLQERLETKLLGVCTGVWNISYE